MSLKFDSCLLQMSEPCWSTDCGSTNHIPGYMSTNSSLVVNVNMNEHELRFDSRAVLFNTQNTCFRHKRLNVHADLRRRWNCAHMLCVSTPRRDLRGWFPHSFRRIYFWSKEVQISQIIIYLNKGRAKKKTVQRRSGLIKGKYKTFATFHSLIL